MMCVSTLQSRGSGSFPISEEVIPESPTDSLGHEASFPKRWSAPKTTNVPRTRVRNSVSISEFRTTEMRRSFTFGGFGILSSSSEDVLSTQELEALVDTRKKEPSNWSKAKITEYGRKYRAKTLEIPEDSSGPWYKDALVRSQPAHLVAILAVLFVAFRLFPDTGRGPSEASTLTRLIYVSCISMAFGSQIWMTFVSGLSLFFTVPRHVFAQVQSVLFPIYFLFNAVLMLIAVVTFTQHYPTHAWDYHQLFQGVMLVGCFFVNLGIRLYLAPILANLITIKVAIETEAGIGKEVGSSKPGTLSSCPHYMRVYRAFRRTHVTIAAGNMLAVVATSFHLYYLATKLCLLT